MNAIRRLKSHFYSEEPKRSDLQLTQDFGAFPPSPLTCTGLDCEFIIVRTRWFGGLFVNLLMLQRVLQVRDPAEISPSLHGPWREIQSVRRQFTSAVQGLRGVTQTFGQRLLFCLVVVPLLLLASLVVIPWAVIKFMPVLVSLYRRIPGGLGYFVPLFVRETRIVVKAGELARRRDADAIVAHEHLHLLQHRNGQLDDKKSNVAQLLLEEGKDEPHLLYLLEKNEVEARLHEIVLSYYRVAQELPLTVDGFVAMLACSEGVGTWVAEAMGLDRAASAPEALRYQERTDAIGNDFDWIFSSIKDRELRRRFITEVLAVMYANLIRYYGDGPSSLQFLQQLTRPNLHDKLYSSAPLLSPA